MRFAIAAAGTGGHVIPAIAVADEIVAIGANRSDILFLGGRRMAEKMVPAAGYPFLGFELTKLRRSASMENLRIPAVVRRAASAMADEIRRHEAVAVLGMSGYVTVPAVMAARRAGIPFFLQEQNARPGLASRYAARRSEVTFLGLPGPAEVLPRSEVVGNPLRPAVSRLNRSKLRAAARDDYGVAGAGPVLGILGGSLGARVLNEAAPRLVAGSGAGGVIHLTGSAAFAEVSRRAAGSSVPWRCIAFEEEMERFYAAVDVVVSRAGALTVSELAATGTPAVLVPLARVGQHHNASFLGRSGAAEIVAEGDSGTLPRVVAGMIGDERRLAAMSQRGRVVALPDAAATIARRLVAVARG